MMILNGEVNRSKNNVTDQSHDQKNQEYSLIKYLRSFGGNLFTAFARTLPPSYTGNLIKHLVINNTEAAYDRGIALLKRGKHDEAIAEFIDAINKGYDLNAEASADADVCYYVGLAYQKLEKHEEAINFFGQAVDKGYYLKNKTAAGDICCKLGISYIKLEDYEEAIKCLNFGIEQKWQHIDKLYELRFNAQLENGEKENAIKDIIDANNIDAINKGYVFIGAINKGYDLNAEVPADADVCYYVGLAYQKLEMHEEAINFFGQAVDKGNYSKNKTVAGDIYCKLGVSYIKLKNYEEAIKCLNFGIDENLEPIDELYELRFYAQIKNGEEKNAIRYIDDAIRLDSKNIEARLLRAKYYQKTGNHEGAIEDLTVIINSIDCKLFEGKHNEINENNVSDYKHIVEAFFLRSKSKKEVGKYKEAIDDIAQARKLVKDNNAQAVKAFDEKGYIELTDENKYLEYRTDLINDRFSPESILPLSEGDKPKGDNKVKDIRKYIQAIRNNIDKFESESKFYGNLLLNKIDNPKAMRKLRDVLDKFLNKDNYKVYNWKGGKFFSNVFRGKSSQKKDNMFLNSQVDEYLDAFKAFIEEEANERKYGSFKKYMNDFKDVFIETI
ncbi:MAG: hypothetical protein GY874_16005 [Desulfobacteraceae bacterium]|nr:hypothetical protein [Desulfobacteraceae bacterium]